MKSRLALLCAISAIGTSLSMAAPASAHPATVEITPTTTTGIGTVLARSQKIYSFFGLMSSPSKTVQSIADLSKCNDYIRTGYSCRLPTMVMDSAEVMPYKTFKKETEGDSVSYALIDGRGESPETVFFSVQKPGENHEQVIKVDAGTFPHSDPIAYMAKNKIPNMATSAFHDPSLSQSIAGFGAKIVLHVLL